MAVFNPKRVLRQISNPLKKEFFERQGQSLPVEWDRLTNIQIDEVFHAWQALPDGPRKQIEIVLHDMDEMATEDGGLRVLIEEGQYRGLDLAKDIEAMDSRFDKVLWVYLNHPEIWNAAVMFARADGISAGRSWTKRGDMPVAEPKRGKKEIEKLALALSAYYRERQGRGHHCHIEHFQRGGEQDYYFVYLSDYADTHINFDEKGELQRTPERRAFEIVFAYERAAGSLEMFAKGGKKVIEPLQRIFSRVILGKDLPPADPNERPYRLDHLMDRGFGFPTDPEDGVEEVALRRMRVSIVGNRRRRILLEPDEELGREAIYDMLEQDLNRARLPRSILHVTKVTIQMRFNGNGNGRALEFDVSYPNSCNLKSKREELRLIGEKYMKRWKIDVT